MDVITFWKNYGRDLETLLDKAHRREVDRLQKVLEHHSHYVMAEEQYSLKELQLLKMIRSVVIEMNRSPEVDSQNFPNPPTNMTNEWISVKDRLPEYNNYVLVSDGNEIWLGDYDTRPHRKQWGLVYNGAPPFNSNEVKYWMPLPLLPK